MDDSEYSDPAWGRPVDDNECSDLTCVRLVYFYIVLVAFIKTLVTFACSFILQC